MTQNTFNAQLSPSEPTTVRPPFDAELLPLLAAFRDIVPRTSESTLAELRQMGVDGLPGQEKPDYTVEGKVIVEELTIPGPEEDLPLTVLRPAGALIEPLPLIYYIHGGGMVVGTRYLSLEEFLPLVAEGLTAIAAIGYRLAPEHPDPAPIEDCYAGLKWVADNAVAMHFDPARLIVLGGSAGGGLAAGTALLTRDRGGPLLTHQVLMCPMLDDRLVTPSSKMLDDEGGWDRNENLFGWTSLLGERRGTADVSPYAAPARAEDLSGLPRTYIDVGSVDGFRDEVLVYAQRLSQAGVNVDLHMWGGAFHGFDQTGNTAPALVHAAIATRDEFLRRALER